VTPELGAGEVEGGHRNAREVLGLSLEFSKKIRIVKIMNLGKNKGVLKVWNFGVKR
jgi:hypothetical protein